MAKKQLKPNIIFLLIDSARADHFSCYGYAKKTTPFIDSLASDGILFENAISPSGSTKPSMYCIFSGMHLSKIGNPAALNPKYPVMAEILRDAGYYTIGISHNPWVSSVTQMDRGFQEFYFWDRTNVIRMAGPMAVARKVLARKFFRSDVCIENILAKKIVNRNPKRPFFLYVHYGDVHHPYDPPEAIVRNFLDDDVTQSEVRRINKNAHHYMNQNPEAISEKTIRILKNLYDGEIAYEDQQIQDLVKFVAMNKLLNDTLIIVTADHGDNIGEAGLFSHKFILNEPLIRVPLVMHLPGYLSGGVRSQKLVQTIDILPTLLHIIDDNRDEIKSELQGYSLLDWQNENRKLTISERIFKASDHSTRLFVKRKYPNSRVEDFKHHIIAMRTNQDKYIWSSLGYHELYNLENDPTERHNLIHEKPEIVQIFEERLAHWRSTFTPHEIVTEDRLDKFSSAMIKQLQALGYVD